MYRGVDATTTRGVVLSVSQICSYDQIKQTLKQKGLMEEGFPLHFTASMFAGFICSVTSNPVGEFVCHILRWGIYMLMNHTRSHLQTSSKFAL